MGSSEFVVRALGRYVCVCVWGGSLRVRELVSCVWRPIPCVERSLRFEGVESGVWIFFFKHLHGGFCEPAEPL